MLTDKQLKIRSKGIGGTDVAGILGLSKYKTPKSIYLEKIGMSLPKEENIYMTWGKLLEPIIFDLFKKDTCKDVNICEDTLYHKKHKIMLANIDGILPKEKSILEIKTSRLKAWEREDLIPIEYKLQIQHYLCVTGFDKAYLASFFYGYNMEFRIYEIFRDDILIEETIIPGCLKFWEDHVKNKIPPKDIVNPKIDMKALERIHSDPKDEVIELGEDLRDLVKNYEYLKMSESNIQDSLLMVKAKMADKIGKHTQALCPGYKVNWRAQNRVTFDSKRFNQDHPKQFKEYSKISTYRPMTFIKQKEGN